MVRPYDLYIKFLVTKGYTELDDINSYLEELGLPKLSQEEFDLHFDQVIKVIPKRVDDLIRKKLYTDDFVRCMKVLGLYDLWSIEKPFRNAETARLQLVYDINYDPEIRTALRALITKKMKHNEICQDLNFKYSYMLRPEHIALYEKFFWDPSRMSRGHWKRFLGQIESSERAILFSALTEPPDVLKTILKLPSKVDILPIYNRIFVQCTDKIEHYIKLNNPEANKEARYWTDTLMQLGDKIKKYEATSIEDFGKSLQMEFDFVSSDFPSPDETALQEMKARAECQEEKDEN